MHYPEMWGFVQFSNKIAGKGTDHFQMNPEEKIKWVLRKIYYRQKAYFREHGTYTNQFDRLKIDEPELAGIQIQWPPELYYTPSLFEAIIKSIDGRQKWTITQDSQTRSYN